MNVSVSTYDVSADVARAYISVYDHVYAYIYVYERVYTRIFMYISMYVNIRISRSNERWGAGVETPKNVREEIGGWGRVPFNEPYAPSLSTIYDGA